MTISSKAFMQPAFTYVERYQVLMLDDLNGPPKLRLIIYQEGEGKWSERHRSEFNEELGHIGEKEIEISVPPTYLQAIDEIDSAEEA